MKIAPQSHRERPWRVHTLAPDFALLDVWRFDLGHGEVDFQKLLDCFWSTFNLMYQSRLARARLRMGRMFGWDDHDFARPIPGCQESSVGARISEADRRASHASTDAPSPVKVPEVRTVYVFDREALYEASNDTIHLMLHVGLVPSAEEGTWTSLAVYIKSRGLFSRIYMAAINPFRHAIVYPTFGRNFEAAWKRARAKT